MTWVPWWVRPMPMWRSGPCTRRVTVPDFVDPVVSDPVVGVAVAAGVGHGLADLAGQVGHDTARWHLVLWTQRCCGPVATASVCAGRIESRDPSAPRHTAYSRMPQMAEDQIPFREIDVRPEDFPDAPPTSFLPPYAAR